MNIELEVRASFELKPIVEGFGEKFLLNYCDQTEPGKYFLAGAHVDAGCPDLAPDEVALKLCDLVETLPESARGLWDQASDRVLDVGLEANLSRQVIMNLFSDKTLGRISAIGARVAVSVYALELEKKLANKEV